MTKVIKQSIVIILSLLLTDSVFHREGVALAVQLQTSSMAFMKEKSQEAIEMKLKQQSHNCNSNIDRLKKGPVDWTKIEGSGKLFTDKTFPADETMLSWKEYPRTVGGLSKYINWFKDFKRPRDL